MSHIAVERNRRRQMNENLKILRSLTPCFYIKRGDQASIIGGVIEFIKELHQVLQALESKKQRRINTTNNLSPTTPLPHGPPFQNPSPTTPSPSSRLPPQLQLMPLQPESPLGLLEHNQQHGHGNHVKAELVGAASCSTPVADVEAKISGSNVILKVISRRVPGQIVRIISVLEKLSFEVLHLSISSMEDTVLYSFVIKIGLECHLSVEELALEVQQSFYA